MSTHAAGPPHEREQRGTRAATQAVVLGLIGMLVFGVILGPLALLRAEQAARCGVRSHRGEILGWIATYAGLLQLASWYGQSA